MSIPASLAANPRLDRWVGFEQRGRVRVAVGKVEYGQGALTGLAQIAAEELDVGMHRLDVVNPETELSPDEGLTVGSMSTESSGASIRFACAEARALFVAAAARRLACAPDEIEIDDGAFIVDGAPSGLDYWARPRRHAEAAGAPPAGRQAGRPARPAGQGVRRGLPARPCPARHAARPRAAPAGVPRQARQPR